MNVKAVVKEDGSDLSEETSETLKVTDTALLIEIVEKENSLRMGLPFNAEVTFKNVQIPIENRSLQICYDIAESYERLSYVPLRTLCSKLTSDTTKSVSFRVPPLISNITGIDINVCI